VLYPLPLVWWVSGGGVSWADAPEPSKVWPEATSLLAHCENAAGLTARTLNSISEWYNPQIWVHWPL
jgi:hypothetical protein